MSEATEAKGAMELILERVRAYVLSGDDVSVERVVTNAVTLSRSFAAQNARLMAENAALWHFVRTGERSALRKYATDTSDSEAIRRAEPRTLGTDTIDTEETKG